MTNEQEAIQTAKDSLKSTVAPLEKALGVFSAFGITSKIAAAIDACDQAMKERG